MKLRSINIVDAKVRDGKLYLLLQGLATNQVAVETSIKSITTELRGGDAYSPPIFSGNIDLIITNSAVGVFEAQAADNRREQLESRKLIAPEAKD